MKLKCPYCQIQRNLTSANRTLKYRGHYIRKSDGRCLNRIWCFGCKKSFSAATLSPNKWKKKRQLKTKIISLLTAGVSQREVARLLKINRKTVVRTFRFAVQTAREELKEWNRRFPKAIEVEFDDLETFEHSKCKPLSVTLMVEYKSRRILGFEVSQMPAKGLLARVARKKYGPRKDHRAIARRKLLLEMREFVSECSLIRSDSNPHYRSDVGRIFPKACYETIMGSRAAVVGQGELKKMRWDPIFSLNHTCAMLRANINRLFRKTWCTTKRPDQLEGHIALYALKHNRNLSVE